MSDGSTLSDAPKSAATICARFEPGEAARALLSEQLSAREYLALLIERRHYEDAVRFLAQALPKRDAVLWACQCARAAMNGEPAPAVKSVAEATERWLADPSDDNRRAAMAAAQVAGFGEPAGSAGLAAFFSGGSLGPAHLKEIPPADNLTGLAVAGAVMLAVVRDPVRAAEKYQRYLQQGTDIAAGRRPDGEALRSPTA